MSVFVDSCCFSLFTWVSSRLDPVVDVQKLHLLDHSDLAGRRTLWNVEIFQETGGKVRFLVTTRDVDTMTSTPGRRCLSFFVHSCLSK